MSTELILTRARSAAARIEELIGAASVSIDAALYRFNDPRLADALEGAIRRGVEVRVVIDRNKYEESGAIQNLFRKVTVPIRVAFGRRGRGSKMHHKFVLIDRSIVLTGSYNWTLESEEQNFENLVIDHGSGLAGQYRKEFDTLWSAAVPLGEEDDARVERKERGSGR